ncbi:hypothetical protein A4G19_11520 [Pasteurellaceae bacterium Macca]|nr:hypothetical protein [Pasteurellaceae bacterium Macca]
MVINGNITLPFYEYSTRTLLAVTDPYVHSLPEHRYKTGHSYFNAGVLYIHAEHWKNHKENLISLTKELEKELLFGDQDVLNLYFANQWTELPTQYNYQLNHMLIIPQHITPTIFHFTGPRKPLAEKPDGKNIPPTVQQVISWFKLYHQIGWQELALLPLGFLTLSLFD